MRILTTLFLSFFSIVVSCQDGVFTTSGDSINCKILGIKNGVISYQVYDMKFNLPISKLKFYRFDFYRKPESYRYMNDVVITRSGDSIVCSVVETSNDWVTLLALNEIGKQDVRTIPASDIVRYEKRDVSAESVKIGKESTNVRFAVNAGWGGYLSRKYNQFYGPIKDDFRQSNLGLM